MAGEVERMVVKVQGDVNQYKQSMQEAQNATKNAFDAIGRLGQSLTLKVTAPLLAFGTASILAFSRFETGLVRTGSLIRGITDNEFAALNDEALRLGRTTAFSAAQATEGMSIFARAGHRPLQIIREMEPTLNLASAEMIGLSEAASATSDVMAGMQIDAGNLEHALDVLGVASVSSRTSVQDLAAGIRYAGPPARSLGVSLEDLTATLEVLAEAGFSGSQAGRGLRTILARLANPTSEAQRWFREMNVQAFDAQGNFLGMENVVGQLSVGMSRLTQEQQAMAAAEIAGVFQMGLFTNLVEIGGQRLGEFRGQLNDVSGTIRTIAERQLATFHGRWLILTSAIEGVAIAIGRDMVPVLKWLTDNIHILIDQWNALDESTRRYVVAAAAVAAALGPLLIIIGAVGALIPGMVTAFITMGPALKIIGGPITLAIMLFGRFEHAIIGVVGWLRKLSVIFLPLALATSVWLNPIFIVIKTLLTIGGLFIIASEEAGGFEGVLNSLVTTTRDLLTWLQPIGVALYHLGGAIGEVIVEIMRFSGEETIHFIEAIAHLLDLEHIDWAGVQGGIITMIQVWEFGLRNFGQMWEIVVLDARIAWSRFVDTVRSSMTWLIPLMRLDPSGIGGIAASVAGALPPIGQQTSSLEAEDARLRARLLQDFRRFQEERAAEIATLLTPDQEQEAANNARQHGRDIGSNISQGMRQTLSGASSAIDAVLFDSSEAVDRVNRFNDLLESMRGVGTGDSAAPVQPTMDVRGGLAAAERARAVMPSIWGIADEQSRVARERAIGTTPGGAGEWLERQGQALRSAADYLRQTFQGIGDPLHVQGLQDALDYLRGTGTDRQLQFNDQELRQARQILSLSDDDNIRRRTREAEALSRQTGLPLEIVNRPPELDAETIRLQAEEAAASREAHRANLERTLPERNWWQDWLRGQTTEFAIQPAEQILRPTGQATDPFGGAPPAWQRRPQAVEPTNADQQVSAGRQVELLGQAVAFLREIAGRETIEVETANLT